MSLSSEISKNKDKLPVKESKRHHRRNKEFTTTVKKEKFKDANGKCEECSKELTYNSANFHHKLSLAFVFYFYGDTFPDHILKSKHNCQVLCKECHNELHENDSVAFYSSIAQNLLEILENWKPPRRRTRKSKK